MGKCDFCHFEVNQKIKSEEFRHQKCDKERKRRLSEGLCIWCGEKGDVNADRNYCGSCNDVFKDY